MSKNMQIFAVLFLGDCILFGFWTIAEAVRSINNQPIVNVSDQPVMDLLSDEPLRYELVAPNENNIIMYDKQTGEYWRKSIESDGGPTEWQYGKAPVQ
ncbi:MAG: hypothetical protein ACI35O_01970 [Bacillaceae bacterium]